MLRRQFLRTTGAVMSLCAIGQSGHAAGDVLLTIDVAGDGSDLRQFTDADLLALPQISFTTSTIWTDGALTFSGPSLADVLAAAGLASGDITLTAVNDYSVAMPRAQIETGVPIIANRINGAPFGVRDKGPLWLVFPYDAADRYQSEEVYSYSIWQLTQITAAQG